jgi:hypothetical protein
MCKVAYGSFVRVCVCFLQHWMVVVFGNWNVCVPFGSNRVASVALHKF